MGKQAQEELAGYIVQSLKNVKEPNQMEEALMAAALRFQAKGSVFGARR